MPYISNVVDRSLVLLASQFQGTDSQGELTRFQKFIKAFALSIQDLEDANNQLLTERNINTAVGVQLDGLGQILGLARLDGQSDDDYREALKFQIFINEGSGTPEEMIAVLKFLTNANKIRYIEYYPAAFQMSTDGLTFPVPPEDLIPAIQEASPAAVQYCPVTATYGVDVPFVFSPDSEIELLWVTDPSDPTILENLELDTADLLYVNRSKSTTSSEGGGFAEAIWTNEPTTPIIFDFDNTGAGQLAEVIYFQGSIPPAP